MLRFDAKRFSFRLAGLSMFLAIPFSGWYISWINSEPVVVAPSQPQFAPLRTSEDSNTVSTRLEADIPVLMKQAKVPGLSIALIRDSKIAWSQGFGLRGVQASGPVTVSTIFEAASLGKPVFAYAVLKLVDQGKLNLDKPLMEYLPSYETRDPNLQKITARIVLSHRTGFPNWRRGNPLTISFTPGERFSYSGEGFVYLQKVVERITGEPIQQFMQRVVFKPLEMPDSSYVWQARFEGRAALPHGPAGEVTPKQKLGTANVAASLHTTVDDYARFVIAVMNGTGLSSGSAREMLSVQVKLDPDCVMCTDRKPAQLSENLAWGLGLGLQMTGDGKSFWHWGDNDNFKSYIVAFPQQGIGVVYFANGFNGLSLRDRLVQESIGGDQPAFAWSKYDQFDSPQIQVRNALDEAFAESGSSKGVLVYEDLREKNSALFKDESLLNSLGFSLMSRKKIREAATVFGLNAKVFPNSWTAFDSLGLIYMVTGKKELAIQNYQKSLDLNPANTRAKDNLNKLRSLPSN